VDVEALVDSGSSYFINQNVNCKPKRNLPSRAGSEEQICFNDGMTNYDPIEGGRRGGFGTHPSGMVNPAAAAYEFSGLFADDYFKKHPYVVNVPESVNCIQWLHNDNDAF